MAEPIKKETTAVVKAQNNEIVTYQLSNGETMQLSNIMVRQLTGDNKNITDGEISMFIDLCKFSKLNPFLKEAFLVKYGSQPAQQIVSLSAFMRMADENPVYEGMEDGIIVQTAKGNVVDRIGCVLYPKEELLGGWCKVYRSDRRFPFIVRVALKEFSKGQSTWVQMRSTMINKVAKVNALRKAFPSAFNGLLSQEEYENSNISKGQEDLNETDNTKTYDIPLEENSESVEVQDLPIADTVVVEAPENSAEPIDIAEKEENPTDDSDIEIIPYSTYKNNMSLYEKVNYPNGDKSYNAENHTMRVRKK